jgi:hypothetical protein
VSDEEFRIRVVGHRDRSWLTPPMDRAAADQFMADATASLHQCGDGPKLIAFPTTDRPTALIRGRDVHAVELVALPHPDRARAQQRPPVTHTPGATP